MPAPLFVLTPLRAMRPGLAGVDPTDHAAAAAGLPPIDSVDVWDHVTGVNTTSPRTGLHVSPNTIIAGDLKLILGMSTTLFGAGPTDQNGWTGPTYPNGTSGKDGAGGITTPPADCTMGCLFNLTAGRSARLPPRANAPFSRHTHTHQPRTH